MVISLNFQMSHLVGYNARAISVGMTTQVRGGKIHLFYAEFTDFNICRHTPTKQQEEWVWRNVGSKLLYQPGLAAEHVQPRYETEDITTHIAFGNTQTIRTKIIEWLSQIRSLEGLPNNECIEILSVIPAFDKIMLCKVLGVDGVRICSNFNISPYDICLSQIISSSYGMSYSDAYNHNRYALLNDTNVRIYNTLSRNGRITNQSMYNSLETFLLYRQLKGNNKK